MAARKLAQEVDKCFKKVAEGVAEFEGIYEKIEQSTNPGQKEKLEDNLKREIKKLQRLRDQIKTWAASNDIKDKGPLLDHRRLIETQMEKFKAVEKAMKTKAYSKEGLSAATKLDPKEQAKIEASEFLSGMVDDLEQQIETLEAESETLASTMKKGKGHSAKQDRMAEIESKIERHKWHQSKLELIRRSLENGGVEAEQVTDLEESIRYYVSDNGNDDFIEDEEMYDDLNLQEDEDAFGVAGDDKVSSQDNQSVQDETAEPEIRSGSLPKPRTASESIPPPGRRPSTQLKSPLPTLATVHNPLPTISNGSAATAPAPMKPASVPARPPGEGLKYASAAAAAAASDKNNVGIAPLPPPPGAPAASSIGLPPLPPVQQAKTSTTSSPSSASVQLAPQQSAPAAVEKPVSQSPPQPKPSPAASASQPVARSPPVTVASSSRGKAPAAPEAAEAPKAAVTNGTTNGVKAAVHEEEEEEEEEEESIYHLPAVLQDLVDAFEATKKRPAAANSPSSLRMLTASQASMPTLGDAEMPRDYQPDMPTSSSVDYPQEPLPIFDDPRLYSRIEPDTLFYVFYYKQGSPHQYLAAKALKDQSWRFHKQYQTWFQRHEEPKSITEEYEQGTYRFFDYESTWMNRRKADFKFAYKFLEDDV